MDIVFRCENIKDGNGFFNSNFGKVKYSKFWKEFIDLHDSYETANECYQFRKGMKCAFYKYTDLIKYFPKKYLKRLLDLDFRFYMIEVKQCYKATNQVFYYNCDVVDKIDITNDILAKEKA